MFSLATIEILFDQTCRSTTRVDRKQLKVLSDMLARSEIVCFSQSDLERFRLIAVVTKAVWIEASLEAVIAAVARASGESRGGASDRGDHHEDSHDSVTLELALDHIGRAVVDDIAFVLDHSQRSARFFAERKEICERIATFQRKLANIRKIVIEGGEKSWTEYADEFKEDLKQFLLISGYIPSSTGEQCLEKLISSDRNDRQLHLFHELKLLLASEVQCKTDLDKRHEFLNNLDNPDLIVLANFFKQGSSYSFAQEDIREIQETFVKYRNLVVVMNSDVKVCSKCLSRRKGCVKYSDELRSSNNQSFDDYGAFPVITSTPILSKESCASHRSSQSESSTSSGSNNSVKKVESEKEGRRSSTISDFKLKDEKIRKWYWSEEETYLVFKGMQEKLAWKEIKKNHFKDSKRSNVNIRDRWRTITAKPGLMKELKIKYEQELSERL